MTVDPSHPANAVRRLELAIASRPDVLALHEQLAVAHHQLLGTNTAETELAAICREQPLAFTSLLHLTSLQARPDDLRSIVLGYTRAIKTAQVRGLWLDDASTPPSIRAIVLHAMNVAHGGRIDLFHEWMEPRLARYGKQELVRVTSCLAMYLGLEPTVRTDPRQRPTFLYFPGLPHAPVFPRDVLPFADWFEAETEAITRELGSVLASDGIEPFHYDVPEPQRSQLTKGGSWDAYFFYVDGQRVDDHHTACPHVASVLARLPLDHVRGHGPEVCFSIMRPQAHILPHRGVTNTRAVLHLGLEIPEDCALHLVGIEQVGWRRGSCFAFDDTYEHEAWNRSSTTRVILLADIWNPYLRAAEREVLAELVCFIGDFNRLAAPVSPDQNS